MCAGQSPSSGSDDAAWPASALWDHAITLYGRPGVRDACLALQEGHGADVCLLLLACWLGRTGRRPDGPALDRLRAEARSWQDGVISHLRIARREMRRRLQDISPELRPPLSAARGRLAGVELGAERALLTMLDTMASQIPAGSPHKLEIASELMRQIVAFSPENGPILLVLLAAAFPESDRGSLERTLDLAE